MPRTRADDCARACGRAKCVDADVCSVVHATRFGHSGWFSRGCFTASALPSTPDGRISMMPTLSGLNRATRLFVGAAVIPVGAALWSGAPDLFALPGVTNDHDGSGRVESH